LLILALAQAPAATDTVRLSLNDAVQRALASGEEMRRARAQVRDADGQVTEALSGALPQVTGSVVYTRQFASIFEDFAGDTTIAPIFKDSPFGAANTWNVELRATQLLWSGGKVGAGLKAAKAFRRGANAQADETAADIAFRVKRAYLDAAVATRLVQIARAGYEQASAHLKQVQRYQQAGTRAEYDLLRAQVDVANQEPTVVAAENGQTLALLELRRLVNVPADRPLELTTPLLSEDGTLPVAIIDSLAPASRPAIAAADAAVGLREQLVRAARADRLPTLSVGTTLSNQAFPQEVSPFDARFRRNWNAEVRLNVPIFLGLRTAGSVRRAQAQLEQARAERDQVVEQVGLDVAQARAEMDRVRALVGARRATVRQAQRAQHLATVRYANGMATQLEVTDARVLMQQAETNEVQAARDYLFALAQLERALGRPVPVESRPIDQIANATNKEGKQP
jgi:outer membrane protein TolC